MGRPPAKDLTERELEVMHVFWRHGEATAAERATGWRHRAWTGPIPRSPTSCGGCTRRGSWSRSTTSGRSSTGRRGRTRTSRGGCWATWSTACSAARGRSCSAGWSSERKLTAEERAVLEQILKEAGPMNDLGMTLAWLAVQVTLVLVPALALHALASRRGPAAGAWVAALSLGLVVGAERRGVRARGPRVPRSPGIDRPAGPRTEPGDRAATVEAPTRSTNRRADDPRPPACGCAPFAAADRPGSVRRGQRPSRRRGSGPGGAPGGAGPRRRRRRAGPAARWACGPSRSAAVAGRSIDDPDLIGTARRTPGGDGLPSRRSSSARCPTWTTPATAGWRRPVVLLPGRLAVVGRRATRRAVLAHELAHIVRGDYAAGLRGPARRGAQRLSPAGALDGRPAPACSRSWRPTRWGPGSREGAGRTWSPSRAWP